MNENNEWDYTPDEMDICPDCGSDDVLVHISTNEIVHQVVIERECNKCGATWGENL